MKRRILGVCGAVLLAALTVGICFVYVTVALPSSEAHTTFAFAADGRLMKSADKMVIFTSNGSSEITDKTLIKAVADNTLISNNIGSACFSWNENKIELYRGGRLIRSMKQSFSVDDCWGDSPYAPYIGVEIFGNDARHRITGSDHAYAYLPTPLLEKLETELNRQGNSFFVTNEAEENL